MESANIEIVYTLEYKRVKNINLRIKPDGSIHVSAPKKVSKAEVRDFVYSKKDFIFKALDKFEKMKKYQPVCHYSDEKIQNVILEICQEVYPYYQKLGIEYPVIRFRKMVSRWGSCHSTKGILTFNLNLKYADRKCIEYVVLHEFTHFLQPNHSKDFYKELLKVCPDYKIYRRKLKEIILN